MKIAQSIMLILVSVALIIVSVKGCTDENKVKADEGSYTVVELGYCSEYKEHSYKQKYPCNCNAKLNNGKYGTVEYNCPYACQELKVGDKVFKAEEYDSSTLYYKF